MSRSHTRTVSSKWDILPEQLDITTWPDVLVDSLSEQKRTVFLQRKQAMDLFVTHEISVGEIEAITQVYRQQIYQLLRRCVTTHEDGRVWGYRALIPSLHVKAYQRQDYNSKGPGTFQAFLNRYPTIQEEVDTLYLQRKQKSVGESAMQRKHIHERFVRLCIKAGIALDEYPLSNRDRGRRSMERYLSQLGKRFMVEEARRYGKEASRHIRVTGSGNSDAGPDVRPYSRVEFDGHRIDAIFAITFTTIDGDVRTEVCSRPQLLVIEDIATRAILGYHLCINQEYSALDVLKCIQHAVVPWKEKTFSNPALSYPSGAGFPSGLIPAAQWGVWDELSYDNGRANVAQSVTDRLTGIIGCAVNPGPVATPERRPYIERLFKLLEDNGYHRLPNTTGSGPKDPKRKDPESVARRYEISYDILRDITEVLLATYNTTPHGSLYGATPLEVMRSRLESETATPIRVLPEASRPDIETLRFQETRKVRGGASGGHRPYINFENVRYTNEILSSSRELANVTLTLLVDPEDLRSVQAYLPSGAELGYLRAQGKWGVSPHTWEQRKMISRLRNQGLLHIHPGDDPIETTKEYITEQAVKKKRQRIPLLKLQEQEQKAAETDGVLESDDTQPVIKRAPEPRSISKRTTARNNESPQMTEEEMKKFKTITY